MVAHGVSTGGLFLIVGMLSERRHTRLISEYGGLKGVVPRLTAAFVIITLSSIGLPSLNGFIGEFLVLLGTFLWDWRLAAVAASGVILSAVYMLWMVQRVYYGEVTNEENRHLPDLTPREWVVITPVIAMAIVMGLFPTFFLAPTAPAVDKLVQRVAQSQGHRVETPAPPPADAARTATSSLARLVR
jgi:NADH-quinone oxidoreductase subunit M